MGTVERRVSDLEDESVGTVPWVKTLKVQLQKTLDRLESFEKQTRRQNARTVGLKEGTEGKTLVVFFGKWIPEVLNMQIDRIKLKRAHQQD